MRRSSFLAVLVGCVWLTVLNPVRACINDGTAPARESQFKSQYKLDEPGDYRPPGTENPSPVLMNTAGVGLSGVGLGFVIGAFWLNASAARNRESA
ncbi:MAG: hypothetical protein HY040_00835 [Planctomycetes bacterium]|nr:hypothetical protein [Planctomycetota bacterium]